MEKGEEKRLQLRGSDLRTGGEGRWARSSRQLRSPGWLLKLLLLRDGNPSPGYPVRCCRQPKSREEKWWRGRRGLRPEDLAPVFWSASASLDALWHISPRCAWILPSFKKGSPHVTVYVEKTLWRERAICGCVCTVPAEPGCWRGPRVLPGTGPPPERCVANTAAQSLSGQQGRSCRLQMEEESYLGSNTTFWTGLSHQLVPARACARGTGTFVKDTQASLPLTNTETSSARSPTPVEKPKRWLWRS